MTGILEKLRRPRSPGRFVLGTLSLVVLVLAAVFTFNYLIDPLKGHEPILERYKNRGFIYYLHTRVGKYHDIKRVKPRTIVLGGSASNGIDPTYLERYTPKPAYNLAHPFSSAAEMELQLEFAQREFDIKEVLFSLQHYAFFMSKIPNRANPRLLAGDPVAKFNNFLASYLSYGATAKSIAMLGRPEVEFLNARGSYTKVADQIGPKFLGGVETGLKKRRMVYENVAHSRFPLALQRTGLTGLREMLQRCSKQGITCRVAFNPITAKSYPLYRELGMCDLFETLMIELAQITPYWDFGAPNSVTRNADNFYDDLHAKTYVYRWMVSRMYGDKAADVPADFGTLVTTDNVRQHLKRVACSQAKAAQSQPASAPAPAQPGQAAQSQPARSAQSRPSASQPAAGGQPARDGQPAGPAERSPLLRRAH